VPSSGRWCSRTHVSTAAAAAAVSETRRQTAECKESLQSHCGKFTLTAYVPVSADFSYTFREQIEMKIFKLIYNFCN